MGEAGGPIKVMWRLQSAFLWRLDTVSLGKHQRNGVERQGKLTTTTQRNGAHVQAQKKRGGTPGEGSPLDPLLRFNKHKGGSALCGARPEALPRDSTTFEKVDETFKRASRSGQTAEATEAMSTGTNQSSR